MASFTCSVCGELRARRGDVECSVCYLLRILAEEHVAGEHDVVVNASCMDCTQTPEFVAEIRAHRVAMSRTERAQAQRRERLKELYGSGTPVAPLRPARTVAEVRESTGRLSTKEPAMQTVTAAMRVDHSQCDHERTTKARATCRRARRTV
jgi:hypothetical protein